MIGYDERLKEVQTLKAGATILLPVTISGVPTPAVKWFFNDAEIELTSNMSVESKPSSSSLSAKTVTSANSGVYKVVAENEVGSDSAEFTVNIKGR